MIFFVVIPFLAFNSSILDENYYYFFSIRTANTITSVKSLLTVFSWSCSIVTRNEPRIRILLLTS